MSYDFLPENEDAGEFAFGGFSWPIVIEDVFGMLFPYVSSAGSYYMVALDEPRTGKAWDDKPIEHKFPTIGSNDWFPVTEDEAKIMARMARNYCVVMRSAARDKEAGDPKWRGWPEPPAESWLASLEAFADWADKSGGFRIA